MPSAWTGWADVTWENGGRGQAVFGKSANAAGNQRAALTATATPNSTLAGMLGGLKIGLTNDAMSGDVAHPAYQRISRILLPVGKAGHIVGRKPTAPYIKDYKLTAFNKYTPEQEALRLSSEAVAVPVWEMVNAGYDILITPSSVRSTGECQLDVTLTFTWLTGATTHRSFSYRPSSSVGLKELPIDIPEIGIRTLRLVVTVAAGQSLLVYGLANNDMAGSETTPGLLSVTPRPLAPDEERADHGLSLLKNQDDVLIGPLPALPTMDLR